MRYPDAVHPLPGLRPGPLAALLLLASGAEARELRLAALFSDGMVLQRERDAPLWGWAEPGAEVRVRASWSESSFSTAADAAGRWRLTLPTPGAGGPHEVRVESGAEGVTIADVLTGEVWVASGQSNMEWTVHACADGIEGYEARRAAMDLPRLRLFDVENAVSPRPAADVTGRWVACTPLTWPGFSAVGSAFGAELLRELDVPIGIVCSSWGGTMAEAWTSPATLRAGFPEFADALQRLDELAAPPPGAGEGGPGSPPEPEPTPSLGPHEPSVLYHGMIAPLVPYAMRGVIWYQGESNRGRAAQYRRLFPALIRDWRASWGNGDFPFLFVQIAPFAYPGDTGEAAELREAQAHALSVPGTGMAVTMDIGDPRDIHPKEKQEVGRRLALLALAGTYGRAGLVASGPVWRGLAVEDGRLRLAFDHAAGGLVARGELTAFTVAGADGVFRPARAAIDGESVLVWSDEVPEPRAARFAWGAADASNLFNRAGLPASSFRTDPSD